MAKAEQVNGLTDKQEAYCQAYMVCGNQSAAYRIAYDAESMNANVVGVEACRLHADPKISLRLAELQREAYERNKVTIDEIVQDLATMVRFDIADLYDEEGKLLPLRQMPLSARKMIQELHSDELYQYIDGQKEVYGHAKKVKTIAKLDAIEKLMKHLGGYEKDNFQKKVEVKTTVIKWGDKDLPV